VTSPRSRWAAGSAVILATACLASVCIPVLHGSAQAEETAAPARITITGLAPVALGRGSSMTVSGLVANASVTPITNLSVRIIIATVPIAERSAIGKAAELEGAYGEIPLYATTTSVVDFLPPGGKASYRIRTDTDQLPLGSPGIYVIGVEATGFGPSGFVILDSTRTLIPYVPEPPAPVNVTWLWPLATTPGQDPDGVLLGDSIPRQLGPRGRLSELLSAGTSSPSITWVVDPQVLQVTADMADGYLVERDGEVRAGTRSDAASAWSDRARDLFRAPSSRNRDTRRIRPLWVTPYADPDADALTRADLTTDLVRATTEAPGLANDIVKREPDGTLAWAAGGRLTRSSLDVLASAGVRTVVLRNRGLVGSQGTWYTPSGYVDLEAPGGRVRALVIDPGLLRSLSLPQSTRSLVVAARQRFLAELAYVALEPTEETRYLIAAPGNPRWNPNPRLLRAIIASLRSTPWTRIVPLDTVLSLPFSPATRSLDPSTRRGQSLSVAYLDRIRRVQSQVEGLRTVLTDPLPVTAPITAALLRAESSAWRTRPREGNRLLTAIEESVAAAQSGIFVIPRDNVVFSGDRGSVPVTVANNFDQPVRVGIQVSADPAARLDASPLAPVEIEPGKRASLEVPVRVIGSDALTVSIQLTDPSGSAFGAPASLELRTTAYSRAALWVAVAAAILLVILVVFDIARRGRQHALRRRGSTT